MRMRRKIKTLSDTLAQFGDCAARILADREQKWRPHGAAYYQRGAIVALMVRQYRLFLYFLHGPIFWDVVLGPTLLRMMIENVITLEWISRDLDRRCAMYIDHGLGQARLL